MHVIRSFQLRGTVTVMMDVGEEDGLYRATKLAETGQRVVITRDGKIVAMMLGVPEYNLLMQKVSSTRAASRPDWGDDPSY